ncbi:prepilin-type N-terminal cleavage/methylation domain-containing protein [Chloroflexota bacterium]
MKVKFRGARRGLTTSEIPFPVPSFKARGASLSLGQEGQGLIEVLIAVAILGIVAVAFLSALATSSAALILADERTIAESLARSELEYIKNSAYDNINNPPQYSLDPAIDIPDGYNIYIEAVRLDPEDDGIEDDDGIQKITVDVYRQDGPTPSPQDTLILSTADYKVNR